MQKSFNEFQAYRKNGKRIFLFLYLDFLFVLSAFVSTLLQGKDFHLFANSFFLLTLVSLFCTALCTRKNSTIFKRLEDHFLHSSYGTSASTIHKFHKLLAENLFEYHFQPIVNAKSGEIFAYEALMRTNPDVIGLLPTEILDLATKENRLYDIEKHTFKNTLSIMKEARDTFQTKKLFINSVSSHQLSDEDFNDLFENYGPFFKNVVMEITEATRLDEKGTSLLHQRLNKTKCQLALDDYGTGYSNDSNLLNSNPHYVKVDRSLVRNINYDPKKQHLVSNLINFAKQNQIEIIAEGIETYEEFEYVIHMGVDYIQGFFTAKPNPFLIDTIAEDLLEKVRMLNCSSCYKSQR